MQTKAHQRSERRLGRAAALAAAGWLLALLPWFVVPTLAVSCPDNGSLTNASVSPGSGTTNTSFTFSVTYQDNAGETPDLIRVYLTPLKGNQNLKRRMPN